MKILLQLLNPVAPHITEELNELCGFGGELARKPWPSYDEKALVKKTVEIALQTNGKVRGRIEVPADLTKEDAEAFFGSNEEFLRMVGDRQVKKLVYVPGRLVNAVIG